ncbi:MAG: hypothetical protein QXN05_04250 [Acidilobaceae archaeon]
MGLECKDLHLCPRCRSEMDVHTELERGENRRTGSRYFRCPVCNFRILIESFSIEELEDNVIVSFSRRRQSRQPLKVRLCYTS